MFNFEDRPLLENLAGLAWFCSVQNFGIYGMLIPICMTERFYTHLPMSLIYSIAMSFSQIALFYEQSGSKNSLTYVYQNELSTVLKLSISNMVVLYTGVIAINYLCDKIKMILSQL